MSYIFNNANFLTNPQYSSPFSLLAPESLMYSPISSISSPYPNVQNILVDSPLSISTPSKDKPILIKTTDYVPLANNLYTNNLYNINKPIPISFYENLNADPRIHTRMAKYFYYKLLDDWLYDDLSDILDNFSITNGVVDVSASATLDRNTDNIEKKIDFIQRFFFTKKDMKKLLHKYVRETGTNWYQLPQNSYFIKKIIERKIMSNIKRARESKK